MDREKVIKGLECCSGAGGQCIYCPYDNGIEEANCRDNLDHDALALIDTQYKLILELQNLISIGTKMMNGGEVE